MIKRNLYRVLGIKQDADLAKIKKAYWKAAKRYHPDRSPKTSKQFREVREAYDVLSDPQKRSLYDAENVKKPSVRRSPAESILSSRGPRDFFDRIFFDFQDCWFGHLSEPLGDRKRATGNLAAEIILTPEEARQGGRIPIPVSYELICEHCQGRGRFAGFYCDYCQGWGKIGREAEVRLQIPAGIRNGHVKRIPLRNSIYQEIYLTLTFRINRN